MISQKARRLLSQILIVCMTLATLNGIVVYQPQVANATVMPALQPEADAYVDGGSGGTTNQNTVYNSNSLALKEDAYVSATPYTRRVFMKFNLAGYTEPNAISSVVLQVYSPAGTTISANVYAVSDDTWAETSLTWNNKPAYGVQVGTLNIGAASGYYEVDLTSYMKTQLADGKASIMIMGPPTAVGRNINSKDNSTFKPQLVITTDTTAPVYQNSTVSNDFKQIALNYNESVVQKTTGAIKDSVYLASNGTDFQPLGSTDTAVLSGNQLLVQLQQPLAGSLNTLKVMSGTIQDAAGNAVSSDVVTEALIGQQDASAPAFLSASLSGDAKVITLSFDKSVSMTGTADELKNSIRLSTDGGTTYGSLQASDQAAVNGSQVVITLNQALFGQSNKMKMLSGALKSTSGNTVMAVDTITTNLVGLESNRTIPVSGDARVDSGTANVNSNFGSESTILVKEGCCTFNRRAFVKFDVSTVGIMNSAKLRLYFTDPATAVEPLTIYAVSEDTWQENTITYNNQPPYGVAISSTNVGGGAAGWFEWDVTDYVKQEAAGDKTVSLVLLGTAGNNRTIASKQSGSNAPQLVVNYDVTPPAYTSSNVSNENKTITLNYDEYLGNNTASNQALKDNIQLIGSDNVSAAMGAFDSVQLSNNKLSITLANRLSTAGFKVRVLGSTLKDLLGNVAAGNFDTETLTYDIAPPAIDPTVQIDATNKKLTIKANEPLLSHVSDLASLKAAVTLSKDGITFAALGTNDSVALVGGELVVTLESVMNGSMNKVKIDPNTLKDSSGNIVTNAFTSNAVTVDHEGPNLQSSYTVNFNKKVVHVFDEGIVSNVADVASLKAAVNISTNSGSSYQPLGANDTVSVSGKTLTITLATSLTGNTNKFRIAANTIKDNAGNITDIETFSGNIAAAVIEYPYAPPAEDALLKAMTDSKSIPFGNKDSAEGSSIEYTASGALAVITMAIASGDRNPDYIDRFVNAIKTMLSSKANMPNLQGGLDSRGQSQMLYAIAMLWNDTSIMSRFTDVEISKIITLLKAGLISTAYTLNDFDENDNQRSAQRIAVNGDTNTYTGGNTNYSEPNMTIFYSASFVLGLENVKSILQNFVLTDFITELNNQGLTAVKDSFEKTTNFGTLANKATMMEKIVKSSKWSFKGIKLDEYLANPLKMYEATQSFMWSKIAEDGDFMGERGMAQEFDSVDQAGIRQSSGYVVLGIDPCLLNRVLLHYYGYWSAPGNEVTAAKIDTWQRAGVSDYYAKTINGYWEQAWSGTHVSYTTLNTYFFDTMVSLGLLNVALFNDTFNYTAGAYNSNLWTQVQGSWNVVKEPILPFNIKQVLTSAVGATPTDPNETTLQQTDASVLAMIYTNRVFQDVSYMAWVNYQQLGEFGILGRVKDANNYYLLSYDGSKLAIKKKFNGTVTTLSEMTYQLNANTSYRFRGVFTGNQIDFYINGQKIISATDTNNPILVGSIGFLSDHAKMKVDAVLVQNSLPEVPNLYFAKVGNEQVELRYEKIEGAMRYRVKYGTQSGVYTNTMYTSKVAPVITGLNNDVPYYFVVTAETAVGKSANSVEKVVTPREPNAVTPVLNSLISDGNKLFVNFTTDPLNTSYIIRVGMESGKYTKVIEGVTGSGYALTLPTSQIPYYVVVSGYNDRGESVRSNEKSAIGNGTTMFFDNFNDGEFVSDWIVSTGKFDITTVNGETVVQSNGSNPDRMWLNQGYDWKDTKVSTKFQIAPENHYNVSEVYVIGRVANASNYYLVGYKRDYVNQKDYAVINKKVNASISTVKEVELTGVKLTTGVHLLEATFIGDTISVYLDGELGVQATNSELKNGTAGLLPIYVIADYDDFKIELLNGVATPSIASVVPEGNQLNVTFGAVAGATGYRIKYGQNPDEYSGVLTVTDPLPEGNIITGLAEGKTYYITVSAFDAKYESANAVPVTGATNSSTQVPVVDKSELHIAIVDAQAKYDAAVVGAGIGQYAIAVKNTLGEAITVANAVYTNETAAQPEVDAATSAIETAVSRFIASANKADTTTVTPPTSPAPPAIEIVDGVIKATPKITGDVATTVVTQEILTKALQEVTADAAGVKKAVIQVSAVAGAESYSQSLPGKLFQTGSGKQQIEIKTDVATLTIPDNMFKSKDLGNFMTVELIVGKAHTSGMKEALQKQIGNKPVIELSAKLDGKLVEWKNNQAPVTISVAYQPTAEELKKPEHITVWYLDGNGNVVKIPSGKYNPVTGTVSFTTTHFSLYTVAYEPRSFTDLNSYGWAKNQIEIMASKGIIEGTGETTFNPGKPITRADFILLLVKTLGLTAEEQDNFKDVAPNSYYAEAVAVAKALNIAQGNEYNQLRPHDPITRQDVLSLLSRALIVKGLMKESEPTAELTGFHDVKEIASYAMQPIAMLVKAGIVEGDGGNLKPTEATTRAEAAVLLYRIYTK